LTLEFRILGPLEVVRDGAPLRLGGPLERTVLAYLLLHANAAVERDRLIDELWPAEPPESAVNVLQTYVSRLRRTLTSDRLLTRPPGYVLRVEPGELDLHEFDRLLDAGRSALSSGDAEAALAALQPALRLWRGAPLRDVVQDGFARGEAGRLDELRLAALEDRLEAELALWRHAQIVGELEALVVEHPLRERLRAQWMLALYRSGRQPEALAAYRDLRKRLADELGIEPSQPLRDLERAILRQDPRLDETAEADADARGRTVLVGCFDEDAFEPLLSVAEPLARHRNGELVLVRLVSDASGLDAAARSGGERRADLGERGIRAWSAAFTSAEPAQDILRFADDSNVALVLVGALGGVNDDGRLDHELASLLEHAPCDAAVLVGMPGRAKVDDSAPVLVPFGGSEHEWAAAEIGAWIARAESRPLRLAGTAAAADGGRRDASRLLASVALLVQHVTDVDAEPALAPAGPDGLAALAEEARVVLLGLPDGWQKRGIGRTRAELTRRVTTPTLLIRGGARPSALVQAEGLTRFTWTITGAAM
jgi:DNA-binding SARP family transcriptional activator